MYVVIVCTASTGRVRRKYFDLWDDAQKYADRWRVEGRRYRVEVNTVPPPRPRPAVVLPKAA